MTRRDSPEYEAHRAARQLGTAPDDPVVATARSTVQLARARLLEVRRRFVRRDAGAADVAHAEAQVAAALDQLDTAAGTGWRT